MIGTTACMLKLGSIGGSWNEINLHTAVVKREIERERERGGGGEGVEGISKNDVKNRFKIIGLS